MEIHELQKINKNSELNKKSSLLIFFCKISPFLPTRRLAHSLKTANSCFLYAPPHPDRLSSRFNCREALWVAPSAIVF